MNKQCPLYASSSYVANFGGNYGNGLNAGAFYLNVSNTVTNSNANIGTLLAYIKIYDIC